MTTATENSKLEILIAEDSSTQTEQLRHILEKNGFLVTSAANGREALELMESRIPDIVVTDILMPEMNGYELCKSIRTDKRLSAVPVILVTTLSDPTDVIKGLEAGAHNFITKPYDERYLVSRIQYLIANMELRKNSKAEMGINVMFAGENYFISAERLQILDLLLSTFENAYHQNRDLIATQKELRDLSERLEEMVMKRTDELSAANARLSVELAERKRADVALRDSEERYRTLFWSAKDAIVLMRDGYVVACNPSALKLFDVSAETLLNRKWFDFSPRYQPDGTLSSDRISAYIEQALAGNPRDFEWQHVRWNGELFDVNVSLNSVTMSGESYLQAMVRDVTEHKQLQQQLIRAQKLESLGQIAGGVAHDFNNIISAMIGFCTLANMKTAENGEVRHYLDQILALTERAASLTRSLLTFSRKQATAMKWLDLNDVIGTIGKLLLRVIGEDVQLMINLSDRVLPVFADSGQIDQILMNLATNARDAMPGGGTLTIKTEIVKFDDQFVRTNGYGIPGDYILLSVEDSGTGMEEKTREQIFEPFFTTKEAEKGTGLGLSIVYGIVKQHNGYINVYSERDKGTVFRIYFPLGQESELKPEAVRELPPAGGKETILLVEDNAVLCTTTRMLLESYGYSVIVAVDGIEAVDAFRVNADRIHLVLMDVVMPKKSGKEAYEEIRDMRPDVKVIFNSGYTADLISNKKIIEEGMDYLSKPFLPRELLKKIREVLDR